MVKTRSLLGSWAFLIGVILALILGLANIALSQGLTITLVVIGIIVGLFNIADKETNAFLFTGIALIIASSFGMVSVSAVPRLANILLDLLIIFVPATIVVAIKNVFALAGK